MGGDVIELRLNSTDSYVLPQGDKGTFPNFTSQICPVSLCQRVWALAKILAKAVSEDSSESSMIREVGGVVERAPRMPRRPVSTPC